jgi:hypothetical protein
MHRSHQPLCFAHLLPRLLSVIINNFHLITMPAPPDEADSPLLVDPDRMLSFPIAAQRLQLVPGRRCQDAQFRCGMQLQQLAQRDTLEGPEAPGMLIVKKLLGFLRREALNHT